MLTATLTDPETGYLYLRADGELTQQDYEHLAPPMAKLLDSRGKSLPIMIELGPDFSGWSMKALWEEIKFDAEHRKQFGRIAVVGDGKWEQWGTEISDFFLDAEMQFFTHAKRANAEQWLRGEPLTELP
ncbi:MAG: STAS/SEC14 domain-containing protein [Burkholderiales bacterium]